MISTHDPDFERITSQDLLALKNWFRRFDSVLVAFSAGVDSSVLAYAARKVLSKSATAITSISPAFPRSEIQATKKIAEEIGIELILVSQDDLESEDYTANQINRCYFCRSNLLNAIRPIIKERNFSVCVDGTHLDDLRSPRPGVRALREAGFRAPYVELGFDKERIRNVSRMVKLSNSEKPPEACLSSRIAYGQKIDIKTLARIESSEIFIRELIHSKIVRVRTIGTRAVVEVDRESIHKAKQAFPEIERVLLQFGYSSVEIDSNGYCSGRMLDLFVQNLI
jgi:uncharacterized protein